VQHAGAFRPGSFERKLIKEKENSVLSAEIM
jgi:hypothetical protein